MEIQLLHPLLSVAWILPDSHGFLKKGGGYASFFNKEKLPFISLNTCYNRLSSDWHYLYEISSAGRISQP